MRIPVLWDHIQPWSLSDSEEIKQQHVMLEFEPVEDRKYKAPHASITKFT